MVLADSHRLPLIPRYLGSFAREPACFRLQDFHLLWFFFPKDSANDLVSYSPTSTQIGLQAPHNTIDTTVASFTVSNGLGSFPFVRHYSENRCLLSLPGATEMFQFTPFTPDTHLTFNAYPSPSYGQGAFCSFVTLSCSKP